MTDEVTIPDADVAQHFYLPPTPEMAVPHGAHVFVLTGRSALHRAFPDHGDISAISTVADEPDIEGSRAIIYLTTDALPVSLVAHEAAHVILLWAKVDSNVRARRWLAEHPEEIAEGIGNLTALVWYNLEVTDGT